MYMEFGIFRYIRRNLQTHNPKFIIYVKWTFVCGDIQAVNSRILLTKFYCISTGYDTKMYRK